MPGQSRDNPVRVLFMCFLVYCFSFFLALIYGRLPPPFAFDQSWSPRNAVFEGAICGTFPPPPPAFLTPLPWPNSKGFLVYSGRVFRPFVRIMMDVCVSFSKECRQNSH